jgi:hypothetical protein
LEKFVTDDISPEVFANASTRVAHIHALIERRRSSPAGSMREGAVVSSSAKAKEV